jgi:hypothetical protein
VALAEDTINYTGSNGEPVHYDVFRKSLTGATGVAITLPAAVGDSVVYTLSSSVNVAWNFSKIFTLAIVQEAASKAVVQAQSISASSNTNGTITGISHLQWFIANIAAFVSDNNIVVKQDEFLENSSITLFDITGRVLVNKVLASKFETIPIPEIPTGIYLYAVKCKDSTIKTGKLFIQ